MNGRRRPAPRPAVPAFSWTLAGSLLLLLLGSGCVSWDPIFRGSMDLLRWLSAAF